MHGAHLFYLFYIPTQYNWSISKHMGDMAWKFYAKPNWLISSPNIIRKNLKSIGLNGEPSFLPLNFYGGKVQGHIMLNVQVVIFACDVPLGLDLQACQL